MRAEIRRFEETAWRLIEKRDKLILSSPSSTEFDLQRLEAKIKKIVIEEVEKAEAID